MRAAFLFNNIYPNYDLALRTISLVRPDERKYTETYIYTGTWGFPSTSPEEIHSYLSNIFITQQGNIWRAHSSLQVRMAQSQNFDVFIVLFESIRQSLAINLHERLVETEHYLGFTQALPASLQSHRQAFQTVMPTFRLEHQSCFVLSSEFDESGIDDEIIAWVNDNYKSLTDLAFTNSISKKDIGARFTIFDASEHPLKNFNVQEIIEILGDEWGVQSEQSIYKLIEVAPKAMDELVAGVKTLKRYNLSAAECAGIAVNFRRCFEEIAKSLTPELSSSEKKSEECKKMGEYKYRLVKYVRSRNDERYKQYAEDELQELYTRIQKLYNICNGGVHDDWLRPAFSTVALRLVLMADDLLMPRKVIKPKVMYEEGLFE